MKIAATTKEVQAWFDEIVPLTEITETKDREQFEKLLGHPGFAVLLGLMLTARQGFYAQLSKIPLHGAADAARASVTQGTISGIELLWQTVLDQCNPSSPENDKGA